MTELKYKMTNDLLVKMLFVKYPELLKSLVAELLVIKYEDIEQFIITNPEMPPETATAWNGRLRQKIMADAI